MTIAKTIEIIRRNAFEEADGNSLGMVGPTRVMLKNADAMELAAVAEYAERCRDILTRTLYVLQTTSADYMPLTNDERDELIRDMQAALAKNPGPGSPTSRGSGLKTRQGDGANPSSGTTFSDFIRNAEGDERREVFERVIDKAIEKQNAALTGERYIVVSGESPRDVVVDAVDCDPCGLEEAVARAVFGSVEDGKASPQELKQLVEELLEREEVSVEDGFLRLYRGQVRQVVPRVEDKRVPLIDPQDVFQWRGDLAAFTAWFGEPMPIDVGEQISVPVYRSASGKWNGRWLRVWCGSWIVRREDSNGEGKRHYTFPDDEFRLFIQPNVGVAAPEEKRLDEKMPYAATRAEAERAIADAAPKRPLVSEMVDRFLSWPLPKDFAPDCHISFKLPDPILNPNPSWPVGTNLFTADQAQAMVEHMLNIAPKEREL